MAEFIVNNNIHSATKVLPFIVNYGKELRIGADIKKKEKVKSNRICRENKKNSRESWSSVKKSIRRDKETS